MPTPVPSSLIVNHRRRSLAGPPAASVPLLLEPPLRSSVEERWHQHKQRRASQQLQQPQYEKKDQQDNQGYQRHTEPGPAVEVSFEDRLNRIRQRRTSPAGQAVRPSTSGGVEDRLYRARLRRTSQPALLSSQTRRLLTDGRSSPPPSPRPLRDDVDRGRSFLTRSRPSSSGMLGPKGYTDYRTAEDVNTAVVPISCQTSSTFGSTAVVLASRKGADNQPWSHHHQRHHQHQSHRPRGLLRLHHKSHDPKSYLTRSYESSSPIVKRTSPSPSAPAPVSAPVIPASRRDTHFTRRQRDRSNSTGDSSTTSASSRVWDELDQLRSRIHQLERTSRLPASSSPDSGLPHTTSTGESMGTNGVTTTTASPLTNGAATRNAFSERPPTGTTTTLTTLSTSPNGLGHGAITRPDPLSATKTADKKTPKKAKNVKMIGAGDNVNTSTSTNPDVDPAVHPLLHRALSNLRGVVSSEVYQSLEVTTSDALSLAALVHHPHQHAPRGHNGYVNSQVDQNTKENVNGNSHGPASPLLIDFHYHHPLQSSPGPMSERLLQRKVDNICRGLTELCIALVPSFSTSSTLPSSSSKAINTVGAMETTTTAIASSLSSTQPHPHPSTAGNPFPTSTVSLPNGGQATKLTTKTRIKAMRQMRTSRGTDRYRGNAHDNDDGGGGSGDVAALASSMTIMKNHHDDEEKQHDFSMEVAKTRKDSMDDVRQTTHQQQQQPPPLPPPPSSKALMRAERRKSGILALHASKS